MKRVVERVQRENEELKKAPGVVTNEKLSNLELENERLKVFQPSSFCSLRSLVSVSLPPRFNDQQMESKIFELAVQHADLKQLVYFLLLMDRPFRYCIWTVYSFEYGG